MVFFDGEPTGYQPQFNQKTRAIFSGAMSHANFKRQTAKNRIKAIIVFLIAVVVAVVFVLLRLKGLIDGVVLASAAVLVVVLVLVSVALRVGCSGKKNYERVGQQSVVFDFADNTMAIVRNSGALVLSADAITDAKEHADAILVFYDTQAKKKERKAILKESGNSFDEYETRRGVVACQKNLLTKGDINGVVAFVRKKATEHKAAQHKATRTKR